MHLRRGFLAAFTRFGHVCDALSTRFRRAFDALSTSFRRASDALSTRFRRAFHTLSTRFPRAFDAATRLRPGFAVAFCAFATRLRRISDDLSTRFQCSFDAFSAYLGIAALFQRKIRGLDSFSVGLPPTPDISVGFPILCQVCRAGALLYLPHVPHFDGGPCWASAHLWRGLGWLGL
ncbi:hypothetical protein AXF42_Ash007767 [Apostasia shenzhenica]|uniref:Uncharacterized protein n=1 Tax=Apostasia shenzhenica TaxID=1088818 RepID=A0A2I0B5B9_9ASPA|nr:hypothetical protein AXF42_Ash007767 [Apostasia shenzhenica]